MGVSTDAVLFWGYCWGEEDVDIFQGAVPDDAEWEQVVLARRGFVNPWDAARDLDTCLPGERYEQKQARAKVWTDANRAEIDAWYEAKNAVAAEFGVEVGSHCSGECPMPYLTVPAARILAHRGYAKAINGLPTADPEWRAKLDRFVAEFGIKKPHPEPRWWLVSYWG